MLLYIYYVNKSKDLSLIFYFSMFASQMYNVFSKALIKKYHENFNITCTSGYAQHNNKLKILQIKFIDNFFVVINIIDIIIY